MKENSMKKFFMKKVSMKTRNHRFFPILLLLIGLLLFSGCQSFPLSNPEDAPHTTADPIPVPESSEGLSIYFLDVGQADAALILCGGEAMLIDGGNVEDSSFVYSFLEKHQIDTLEYVIATHAHEDHVGGLAGALNYAQAKRAFCSVDTYTTKAFNNFLNALEKQEVSLEIPSVGDTFSLSDATFTILGPHKVSEEHNNMSLVIRVNYYNTSFLFMADAEREEIDDIEKAELFSPCDLIKVGHHGSENATTYLLLRESNPSYAILSVGKDNDYGHPSEKVLSLLSDAEVTTYRTDHNGTILCTSDGNTLSFVLEKGALSPTDPSNSDTKTDDSKDTATDQTPPAGTDSEKITIVVNRNNGKVHRSDCASLPAEKNRLYYNSKEEAAAHGYTDTCGNCKP